MCDPGDVQPFVALAKGLIQDGHRVRIATHGTFASFVKRAGIEFYDIGGNPQDVGANPVYYFPTTHKIFTKLMSYMVKSRFYLFQECWPGS